MPTTVKISEAETHLFELLARVEAGEEMIILRGNDPVARLLPVRKEIDLSLLINEVRVARGMAQTVNHDESWPGGTESAASGVCRDVSLVAA